MSKLSLNTMVLGAIETNVYIISNEDTKECVIVDPAAKSRQILQRIDELGLTLKAILLTHGHFDHLLAVKEIKEQYPQVPVYAHEQELDLIRRPKSESLGVDFSEYGFTPDIAVHDGDVLELIGFTWTVLHTPGHTIGSVCYYLEDEKMLIAGDTVFECGFGRTDLETGSETDIIRSFKEKIFTLQDDVRVYPGHGYGTTIGKERMSNMILMYMN